MDLHSDWVCIFIVQGSKPTRNWSGHLYEHCIKHNTSRWWIDVATALFFHMPHQRRLDQSLDTMSGQSKDRVRLVRLGWQYTDTLTQTRLQHASKNNWHTICLCFVSVFVIGQCQQSPPVTRLREQETINKNCNKNQRLRTSQIEAHCN